MDGYQRCGGSYRIHRWKGIPEAPPFLPFGFVAIRGVSAAVPETSEPLAVEPHRKRFVFAKDECEALVDNVVAAGFQIPAIMLQSFKHVAIEPDRDLVPF